ncbi:hypothetical protein KQX54_015882 [Cotesia glomerata]|uniref:Uncharacterized protein n=1 Tax=Cotesia glomerata TaxID=32391 RepID=A0AAV7IVQ2_COTGL|nr:hypothetical protein KQX54_015882 [Cotesia glomerata]
MPYVSVVCFEVKVVCAHQWYDSYPEWRKWVKEIPSDPAKFFCVACKVTLSCGCSEILRHSKSGGHIKNMHLLTEESTNVQNTMPSASVQKAACALESESYSADGDAEFDFKERVQIAELRFATFFAENNISLTIASDMLNLFQTIGKEPAVLQAMKVGKTKVGKLIGNVLGVVETDRIDQIVSSKSSKDFRSMTRF